MKQIKFLQISEFCYGARVALIIEIDKTLEINRLDFNSCNPVQQMRFNEFCTLAQTGKSVCLRILGLFLW